MRILRRAISIRGVVQGVGFRPFVHELARRHELGGFVRNRAGLVDIEIEGPVSALDAFERDVVAKAPDLADIVDLQTAPLAPRGGAPTFVIAPSHDDCVATDSVFVSHDVATCEDCLRELFDPTDRRYRYPFLNCTRCGPRFTIVASAPYDRERTTMASFPMCPDCRREYEDPTDRRFHAQPTACAVCGPKLTLRDGDGETIDDAEPLRAFAAALLDGAIGALKGLGGYHLVCDARSADAVSKLRHRKHRDAKPFAMMARDVATARTLACIDDAEARLLESAERPIVLLRAGAANGLPAGIAPGVDLVGIMLPYTPLHHLLLDAVGGRPLVMTSGNRSDEPITFEDARFREDLGALVDCTLGHDRAIFSRCDDSVVRVVDGAPLVLRRARGYAPRALRVAKAALARPTLAVGAELKSTFALGDPGRVIVSHHIGDLEHYEAARSFAAAITHYESLFEILPQRLVHDLHPDYASTRYALDRAARTGVATIAIQHHHAHMAGCLAENGFNEPALGIVFDGTGLGADGTLWGGEFLLGDRRAVRRVAHLRPVPLPGGDAAVREVWRMGLVYAAEAELDLDAVPSLTRTAAPHRDRVLAMIGRRVNAPLTSSAGRLFDAAAALAGVCQQSVYEAQAPMQLESLAASAQEEPPYPMAIADAGGNEPLILDPRPLMRALVGDVTAGLSVSRIARRFHEGLANGIADVCMALRTRTGIDVVALSGGVFVNAVLLRATARNLTALRFRVLTHRRVPPNDGGLSFGQLAVAAARDAL